jgi:prevent-host-death family protein
MAMRTAAKERELTKRYSIAEARQNLAAVIHDLERCARIEITRRGKPVAVMLSMREFERVSVPRRRFSDAYEAFRETVNLSQLGIDSTGFEGVRDLSPGRQVEM